MTEYIKFDSGIPLFIHEETSEKCLVDVHIHDNYEIFQAMTDNIKYFVEGRAYNLRKSDIIITSNKEIHRPTTIDYSPNGRRFIQFGPQIVQVYQGIDYSPLRIFEDRKKGNFNHLSLPIDAHSVIDQHFSDPFDLNALSSTYHMNKYYLSHLFKENTGFTLLEYVQSKRMILAKTLLDSDMTVNEISEHCGYNDYSNFFKTFKKMLKVSPNQYRNRDKKRVKKRPITAK